jgi:hypothetical protein
MANYRISELDFDEIKVNLKQFLTNYRDKDNNLIFKDYDFDASSLSILLDILSYNTYYNSYLANMVANEMFLDSANKRESAISIAKHLGYTPLSYRSARAKISFVADTPVGNPSTLTLPKFSTFTTTINGTVYTFSNLDSATVRLDGGNYTFSDITIVEGEPLSYTYRVDISGPSEKYIIPNLNIDTTTVRVTVQNSYSDITQTIYTSAKNLEGLTENSLVYFLEQNPVGYYEIFFGDGVLGKKLTSGNLVKIEYLVSNGSACNISSDIEQQFSLSSTVGNLKVSTPILAVENSNGGDEPDTLDEIKFKAPRFLSSFNRAVTSNDYKSIIESNYPLVESVSVWGGEENVPPVYGKVIISLKPYQGYTINEELKNKIKEEILKDRKMLTVIPEFVDPNYLYITLDVKIKFDSKNSRYTISEIESLARSTIQEYFRFELQKFNKPFIYSKLSRIIDSLDQSIIGNVSSFKVQKRITPEVNVNNGYAGAKIIKFANKLVSGTLQSTVFYYEINQIIYSVYMKDVLTSGSEGVINLYDSFNDSLLVSNIGTVNYSAGTVSIPVLNPAGFYENSTDIRISCRIEELDILSSRDLILIIDDSTSDVLVKRTPGLAITISTS